MLRVASARGEGGRRNAEHDEAHVIHRRIGHQALEVGLAERAKGSKDNGCGGKQSQRKGKVLGLLRIERQDESQETIGAQLQTARPPGAWSQRWGPRYARREARYGRAR